MSDPKEAVSKPEKKEKKDKKHKKEKADMKTKKESDTVAQDESNGLNLFKGKQSQLDDIFGKGVSSFHVLTRVCVLTRQAELALPVAAKPTGLPSKRAAKPKKTAVSEAVEGPTSTPATGSHSNKRQKKAKAPQPISDSDDDEAEKVPEAGPSTVPVELDEEFEDDSDSELVHEAAAETSNRKRKQASKLPKYVPAGETSQDRDRRTIFVGNLPIDAAKSKVSFRK